MQQITSHGLRVAFIKQELDVFGPWSSVRWDQTTPEKLFDVWPNKASIWEMTCLLKADWYIVPQKCDMQYTYDAILNHPGREEIIRASTRNIVQPSDIPFSDYDVVIALDPVIDVDKNSRTLFAYCMNEHWESLYNKSLIKPIGNYDLFLAHMMDSASVLKGLPQSVSFPLLRSPATTRQVFNAGKQEKAWADWRTLIQIAGITDAWTEDAHRAAKTLESIIEMPVCYKAFSRVKYNFTNPPLWGDAAKYLGAMAECKYYISVRVAGAGQGICDAASLGCICIGKSDIPCHKIICHPMCLCESNDDLSVKMKEITQSQELHKEILDWQDKMLNKHFVEQPLGLLQQAVEMKRSRARSFVPKTPRKDGLTIFALPKAFVGHNGVIQRNAIKSWTLLSPKPEIILMGNDAGVAQYAAEMGLRHIAEVRKNEFGTPLVSDLFARAQEEASNDVLMYINSDIILLDDFMTALGNVRQRFDEFLMVGQRWNTPITSEIDFGIVRWREQLREFVNQNSVLFATCGIDYFVFTHGLWSVIPDFGIGRSAWDNWLVWKPMDEGKVVVDATDVVMAIHQDHEYIPSPSKLNEEAQNRSLCEDAQSFGFTSSAAWKCTPAGVVMRNAGEFLQNNYNMTERAFMYIEKSLLHDPQAVERDCRHAIACMPPELLKIFTDGAKDLLSKQPHHSGAAMVVKCITEKSCSIGKVVLPRGAEYLREGHAEEALKWFDVLIGLDVPNLNYARAVAFSQLGKYGSARQACLDELKLQPGHDDTQTLLDQIDAEFKKEANELCMRGLSKMQNGNFVAALADFESAALRCFEVPVPNLHYAKAVALSRLGKLFSAKQACLEELKFQPGHAGVIEMLEKLNKAIDEYNASKEKGRSETKSGATNPVKKVDLKISPLEQSEVSCPSTMLRTGK